MDGHTFLVNLGIALIAAFVGGLAARLMRLPVLIGYLLAGIAIGPYTPGMVANREAVEPVAELGVAFLMFAVGVHFSLKELRALWRTAVFGGGLQILGTTLLGIGVGMSLGWGVYGGLFLGCALALSSTAVMMKVLEERGEQGTTHGSVMLGILVVQDLSLVLMIVLLPALAQISTQGPGALNEVAIALVKAVAFLGAILLLAVAGIPALMHQVAKTGSRELFLILVICLCLATSVAADAAGLGLELGAFLAGLMISETDYAHEAFSQVRPLRDVFASLFFVSVGMLLQPRFVLENTLPVVVVVAAIVLGKSLITFLAVYLQGWHGRTALLTGLGLAQIGEFSFVLATVGSSRNLIPEQISGVLLSAALITLLLAPFLFSAADPLYHWLNRRARLSAFLNRQDKAESLEAHDSGERPRVLIAGYGRVGRYVSNALRAKSVPHRVLDYDASALAALNGQGVSVLFGDASSQTVLEQADLGAMELAVVALPEADTTEMTVRALKRMAPSLPVVARVHRGIDIPRLRNAGADAVIHAEFEAGTEMIRQSLDRLRFADKEVDTYIEEVRQHRYRQEAP
jgi:monovalent cation:H+ antiporter-2, CPA2 family